MTAPKPGEKVLVEVHANTRDDDGTFLCEGTWHAPVCTPADWAALCEAAGEAVPALLRAASGKAFDEEKCIALADRLESALAAVGRKPNG